MAKQRISSQEVNNFLDLSPDLIAIVGLSGHFLYVNSVWENILGYKIDELIGRRFIDFVHPDDQFETQQEAELTSYREKPKDFENRYLKKNGESIWLQWRSTYDSEQEKFYCVVRDITEKKELSQTLKELKTKEKLVEDFSQEINSLIFNVAGHSELIENEISSNDDHFNKNKCCTHLLEIKKSLETLKEALKSLAQINAPNLSTTSNFIFLGHIFEDLKVIIKRKKSQLLDKIIIPKINRDICLNCKRAILSYFIYEVINHTLEHYEAHKAEGHILKVKIDQLLDNVQIILEFDRNFFTEALTQMDYQDQMLSNQYGYPIKTEVSKQFIQKIITLKCLKGFLV